MTKQILLNVTGALFVVSDKSSSSVDVVAGNMARNPSIMVYSSVVLMTLFLLAPPAAAHFILLKKLFKGLLGEEDSGYSYSLQGHSYNRPSYPPPYYGGGYYAGGAGYQQPAPIPAPVGGGYGYGGAGPAYQPGPVVSGPGPVSYGSGGSSSSNQNSHHHSSTTFHHTESHSSNSNSHEEGGHHHEVSGGFSPSIVPQPGPIGGGVPPYAGFGSNGYPIGNPAVGGFGYGRSGDDSSVEASPYDSVDLRSNNLKSASISADSSGYDKDAEFVAPNTDYSVPSVQPIGNGRSSAPVIEALPDQPLSSLNLDKAASAQQSTRGGKSYVRFPPFD